MNKHTVQTVEISAVDIDRTGSMKQGDIAPTRLAAAQAAAVEFVKRKRVLDARDVNTIVGFNTGAQIVSPFGRHPWEVTNDVRGLTANGGTSVTSGLRKSLDAIMQEAKRHPHATRRIILLTDGEHNTGPAPREDGVLAALRSNRVIVDCVLIGKNGEQLLREIAADTGGEFLRVSDFQTLLDHYRHLASKKAGAWRP